jgi:trans-2,3-dihydro-3-hydroxyanthranilate isomerase
MRTYRFVQVDVFGFGPFTGNPLAVFPEALGLSDDEMQAIAREMNLSETTFVTEPTGAGDVRVRIFTPGQELPFAGHPSLGTACTAVRLGLVPLQEPVTPVRLELNVGPTLVEVHIEDGEPMRAVVHQGAPHYGARIPRAEAAAVLGLAEDDLHPDLVGRRVGTGLDYAIIPLKDTEALGRAWFAMDRLAAFEEFYSELYPFAFTGDDQPFAEARCFAPAAGIVEDPATGSAAGPLAAYLAHEGILRPGETKVLAQGQYTGRPSRLEIGVEGEPSVEGEPGALTDVLVGGTVVPMIVGELTLPV